MTVQIPANEIASELQAVVRGPVHSAESGGYADEAAGFNLAVPHHPSVAVGVLDALDVQAVVRLARSRKWKVAVQTTGHGSLMPIDAEVLISTRRMDAVSIDVEQRVARIGGGARWGSVVALAAEHGLLPITGSSPHVGVVGYLMGGGLGPLARSHGFSSDYVVGATMVTGTGELLEVDPQQNADLYWAIRGGKYELGIITEIRVRLVELATLYGGSLLFGGQDIETVVRGWAAWTETAPADVTTSLAIAAFPDMEQVPPFLRGRRVAALRFAYPGGVVEGERLAAPLRALAAAEMDAIGPLAAKDVGLIHNDPTDPGPSWLRGAFLSSFPNEAASIVLDTARDGSPFSLMELRHYGGHVVENPAGQDAGDSAVGGRDVHLGVVFGGFNPGRFAELPDASDGMLDRLEEWISPVTNINFTGHQWRARHPVKAWSDETMARLSEVQRAYDPDGVFHWWDPATR